MQGGTMKKTLIAATICLLAAAALLAADVSGTWNYKMPTPDGEMAATLTLKVDGETLTGTFEFEGGRKLEITNGTVKGNELKFTVKRDRPSGGFMTYEMTGTVEGDTIKGATKTQMDGQDATSEWSATRK